MVNCGTVTEIELFFLHLKQFHELGWFVIRKLVLLLHVAPEVVRLVTEALDSFDVFGHLHFVYFLPRCCIYPLKSPLLLESLDCTS